MCHLLYYFGHTDGISRWKWHYCYVGQRCVLGIVVWVVVACL